MVDTNGWHAARLIPASGIDGAAEQERRATSALLSVIGAVPAFGRALTEPLGAPSGPVETFVDVPLPRGDHPFVAAGVIRVHHAPDVWTAVVEVRAGLHSGDPGRVEDCLDAAAEHGFDAVVTVGGEPPAEPPAGSVAVRHLGWGRVVAEAVRQRDTMSDPARAWILRELVRYLEHPASGVSAVLDEVPVIEKAPAPPVVPADARITNLARGPRVVDLTRVTSSEPAEPDPLPDPLPEPLPERLPERLPELFPGPLPEPAAAHVPEPEREPEPLPLPPPSPAVAETPLPPVPVITTPVRSVLRELLAASDGAPPTAETPRISLPAEWGAPAPVRSAAPEPPTVAMPEQAPEQVREPVPEQVPEQTGAGREPQTPSPQTVSPQAASPQTAGIPITDPALRPTRGPSRREIRLARTLDALTDHEPGWYLDPGDDGKLRWWSGSTWGTSTYEVQRLEPHTPTRGRTHDAELTTH